MPGSRGTVLNEKAITGGHTIELQEAKAFVKGFFNRYYDLLYHTNKILVKLPGVPEQMLADEADPQQEWNVWKLIPSTVTNADLQQIEALCACHFPVMLKAFFQTYHHIFDAPIGRNSIKYPFESLENAFNPHLATNGFLPFTWDEEYIFIRYIDLENMPDEAHCPVMEIDHEELFNMQFPVEDKGKMLKREQLIPYMKLVSDNLFAYLEDVYHDFEKRTQKLT